MGEIADMMLDGTLCEGCGTFLGEPVGYPRYCESCKPQKKKKARPCTTTNEQEEGQ